MAATISFKPVRDKEERMSVVREFLESRAPLYGPQENLLRRIQDGTVKCRLIASNEHYEGLFAYRPLEHSVHIECFAPLKPERFRYADTALDELVGMVSELHPSALSTTVHKTEEVLIQFFKDQGFREIDRNHNFVTLERTRKRARDDASPPHPAAPAVVDRPVFKAARKPVSIPIKQPYLGQIQRGEKTIEGRINTGMFRNLYAGSLVRFWNQQGEVVCKVQAVRPYPSFRYMLQKEGFRTCIPSAASQEDAVRIYDQIPGYAEKAARCGVLAIELAVQR